MTSQEVSRIQSELEEMDKGLNEFFLKACKLYGEGTYRMARNQKKIIEMLQKLVAERVEEDAELSKLSREFSYLSGIVEK